MACLALAALIFAAIPVEAQEPQDLVEGEPGAYLAVDLSFPNGAEMTIPSFGEKRTFIFSVDDISRDGSGNGGVGQPHNLAVAVTPIGDSEGWKIFQPVESFQLRAGQSREIRVSFNPLATAVEFDLRMAINVTLTASYTAENVTTGGTFLVRSPGSQFAFLRSTSEPSFTVNPDDVFDLQMTVINPGLQDRSYRVEAVDNTCNLKATNANIVVPAGEMVSVGITVVAPAEKVYYNQQSCILSVKATDVQSNRASNSAIYNIKVQGAYVDPGWIFNITTAGVVIAGITYFILILKRRTEEEVLGKPQPPWTLPAEQVYLEELEKQDPRAAYVVRHFLMEDEYHSSLLWYSAYKKATRGRRAMERKVLKVERAFEKWDTTQQGLLDGGNDGSERKIEKLQAKLDRKGRKSHKKIEKKWRKVASKLESGVSNDHNKAMNEWRKVAKKAKKNGATVPSQPAMPNLVLPPKPELTRISLDNHKWVAKKHRILDSASNSEVKAFERYESARTKRLAAIEKKLAKMAKKIDDPAFVKEHPLLQDAIASSSA